ncbi:WD40 repeat-like protein [Paxillus ammoniavirescens]|nr:WD40 repeat-like protein [Paxillus ammoniavirescens]
MSNTSPKSTDLTAKPLTTMSGRRGSIRGIAYLPGGKRVVSCSNDKTVRLWDVEQSEQEGTLMVHEVKFDCFAVTRDGKRILSGGEEGTIRVWEVETHKLIEEWTSDRDLGNRDQGMKERGEIKRLINAGTRVFSLCFSPNGEKLAWAVSRVIQVYDIKSGKLVLPESIKGHETWINCILWSLDGTQLFSASNDRTIRCWNPESGESIGEPWTGHTNNVTSLSLSPDGTKLASTSHDGTVRFWDVRSGDPIGDPLQHANYQYTVAFSPCGEFVASGGFDKEVSICRVPWWDEGQKQAHHALLIDLPAVPAAKDQHQDDSESLDLPATRRTITSSSRLPAQVADPTTTPIKTRVQRFQDTAWNLNDIRCNFAHNLTGYVVQEGKDPFACGSFGDIYRGKLRMNGTSIDVAIRTYGSTNDDDDDDAQKNERLLREIKTWVNLQHVNILPLFGTTMGLGRFPAMICPWLENGTLSSYLTRRHDTLKPLQRLALINDAAAGLQYLHSKSIVHGNLSGSNVLIDGNGRACISDFGLSMVLTDLGGSTYGASRHEAGTLRWAAPELLGLQEKDSPHHVFPTPPSDVYSFGRIILQALTGEVPYHYYIYEARVRHAISKGINPTRPNSPLVTDRQWAFMQRCWMPVDADESRPCADEIVEFAREELLDLENALL